MSSDSGEKIKVRKENLYSLFKPYLGKLFSYIVLLIIALNGYKLFKENQESYEDFIDDFREKIVTDIVFINKDEKCPNNYQDVTPATFTESFDGCICNGFVLKKAQCNIFEKVEGTRTCQSSDKPNFSLNNYFTKCDVCYTEVQGVGEILIDKFYGDVKPCLKYDEELTTLEYLKTATLPCSEENRCQDFFCKLNNDYNNKCPITFVAKNVTPALGLPIPTNDTGPFKLADGYMKYQNYDSNDHGYINMPITGIFMAFNGVCDKNERRYISDYPLIKLSNCHPSEQFRNFDTKSVDEVLRNNGLDQIIYSNLTRYSNSATQFDTWSLVAKTAMSYNTLYCIINSGAGRDLNLKNLMITFADTKREDEEERREIFSDYMYTFVNIEANSEFQNSIQSFMLILNIFITSMEIIYVLVKFIHSLGINLRGLLNVLRFEGYICFLCDIAIAITGYVTYHNIEHFLHYVEELMITRCLDEYAYNKLLLYKSSSQVVADKSKEICVIVVVKLLLVIFSVITTCISNHGKVPFVELQELICEVRELPQDKHKGNHKQMEDEVEKPKEEEEKPNEEFKPENKIEHLDR
jgi:viroplasmin and RNaseH domain-containing protein